MDELVFELICSNHKGTKDTKINRKYNAPVKLVSARRVHGNRDYFFPLCPLCPLWFKNPSDDEVDPPAGGR
jgi:hypothetical protein